MQEFKSNMPQAGPATTRKTLLQKPLKQKAADTLPSTCCGAKRGSEAHKHSVVKVA